MSAATRAATAAVGAPKVAGARRAGYRLSLVPPMRSGAPRTPFVLLVSTLLAGGLAGLLFLHTALAEDSFRLQDLKNRSAALAAREQALEQEVALAASPRRLAARAEALGMVRGVNPAFIRLSDGRVLGRPRPATAPPPPVSTAVPSPLPSAAQSADPTPAGAEVTPTSQPGPGGGPGR